MIIIKDNSVKLKRITPGLALMFYVVELYHREGNKDIQPKNLVITSINDGKHLPNSRHYKDEAFDMRSKNFSSNKKKMLYKEAIQNQLNVDGDNKFTVLLENIGTENEHFHFQVKKGLSYP
jgi:hypothetical protein